MIAIQIAIIYFILIALAVYIALSLDIIKNALYLPFLTLNKIY